MVLPFEKKEEGGRERNVKRERVSSAVLLPFSPRQWGRSTELSIVFAFLSRQETGLERATTSIRDSAIEIDLFEERYIDPAPTPFPERPRTLYYAPSSNNRSVSTLTNFRELAIKGNEETGKSKCGVNIDGGYRRLCCRNSCENSPPRFDNLRTSSFRVTGFHEISTFFFSFHLLQM